MTPPRPLPSFVAVLAAALVLLPDCVDGGLGGDDSGADATVDSGSDASAGDAGNSDAGPSDAGNSDAGPSDGGISGTAYYLDCAGNDSRSGTSPADAWQTFTKANAASLQPGDALLLKRDCIFSGKLVAAWNGTAGAPILIGAYGTGAAPLIRNDAQGTKTSFVAVEVTGSYQHLEDLAATVVNPYLEPNCLQSDAGAVELGWYVAFNISGHHNVLRRVEGYGLALGIQFDDLSASNQVFDASFHDLHALWRLSATSGAMGAMGINLHGTENEIGFSRFERNAAACDLDAGAGSATVAQSYSAPFEVYNANRCVVHHNQAFGHRKHFEMGHDSANTTDDNVLAYNLFVSDTPRAVGPNIHGLGNQYGPVNRTRIFQNTIVFTGQDSQGIVCGCSGGATVENNVFVAEWKAGYYDGAVTEDHNLYWDLQRTTDSSSDPFVQFTSGALSGSSMKADPQFVDAGGDCHLGATSPAINAGASLTTSDPLLQRVLSEDLDQQGAPQGAAAELGAYERAP